MKNLFHSLILIALLSGINTVQAQEISFVGVSGDLLVNIERHVRLVKRLREKTTNPLLEGERRRLESRIDTEIRQALEPFGYYNVGISVDERQLPKLNRYVIALNKPVVISDVNIKLNKEALTDTEFKAWLDSFPLQKGLTLNQAIYSDQKKALLSLAIGRGYFDAKYLNSEIIIDKPKTSAKIKLIFDSGKRYTISDIVIDWNIASLSDKKNKLGIEQDIIDSLLEIKGGQFYTAEALSKTQRNLLTTPYFSSVDVHAGERDPQSTKIPVKIILTPGKRKAYNFAIGAGTDTGVRGSVGYENRRINKKGHNINARIGGSDIKRTAIINYRIPLTRSVKDSLNFFASVNEESGDTRRFKSFQIGSEWAFEWHKSLLKLGLTASRQQFVRRDNNLSETEQDTDLLMPSAYWERTKGDDLYFPSKGWSASVLLRAASESFASDIDLAQIIFKGKLLRPLASGRLKLRFQLAGSLIDQSIDLPESLGFLAGGDDSIRGYDFESIGVNRNGEVSVAKNLAIGSIEYEHPIKNGFALATFVDIGDAFDSSVRYKKGAGIGLRWRLPFGALRLDAASALDLEGQPWRLHFSFGTDL